MPDWLIEQGIGETRAVLVEDGNIVEARILVEGTMPAGSVLHAQLKKVGIPAIAEAGGREYMLPRGAPGGTEGAAISIEITREAIPGPEPWKRPLAKCADGPPGEERLSGEVIPFPAPRDALADAGWNDLLDEARTGRVEFDGGSLGIFVTPAMTLTDVDGQLPPAELAVAGARAAAMSIRRLDIGGSIGIDLPTVAGKAARQAASEAIDAVLPQPFERTAMNGFGFLQIVRPRRRASLLELAQDRAAFEARALLRRAAFDGSGARRLAAHPAVIAILETRPEWTEALGRQIGGAIGLRADASIPIHGGYAEKP